MIRCNLLPWRAWERKKHQQAYYTRLGLTLIISCALSSTPLIPLTHQIKNQIIVNKTLEQEQTALQAKLKYTKGQITQRNNLLKKQEAAQCIDEENNQALALLIKAGNQAGNGIALQSFAYQQQTLTLTGRASNTQTMQNYLARLKQNLDATIQDIQQRHFTASISEKNTPKDCSGTKP